MTDYGEIKKMKKILIALMSLVILTSCQTTEKSIKLTTQSGYTSNALSYFPNSKKSNETVFVIMHGKSGKPNVWHHLDLYPKLTNKGYEIIAPKMPWSRDWSGTPNDGILLIDEVVNQIVKRGKKVVLVGHSLGGTNAFIYAAKNPKKGVLGIVTVAPGHMLHRSNKLQRLTANSVEKAQRMVSSGKGNEKSYFTELNTGKTKDIYTTATTYLSYYDTGEFPDIEQLLPNIKLPVLWVAGSRDRLTNIYNMEALFENLPENPKSKYLEIDGGHRNVLANSAKDIMQWVKSL